MKADEFRQRLADGTMTRRAFNRALAAAGLGLAVLPATARRGRAAEEILVFTWSGYELPEFHQAYIDKYGGSPQFTFFGEQEEALQKMRAGFTPDLSHPCSESVLRWRNAGILDPIDNSRITHWGDVWPELKGLKGTTTEDGKNWFVPFDWGNASVLYRTDLVDIEEESWSLLFDERYDEGRISMYDEGVAAVQVAAAVLGYDNLFSLDDRQLSECRKLLRKQRKVNRFYWSDQTSIVQALASGELVAAYAWNDAVLNLKDQGVPVAYMNPKEGIRTWVCGLVRINTGEGDENAAYDFINALLEPESGRYLIDNYGYGHSNRGSFDLVSAERLAGLGLERPSEVMARGVFLEGVEPEYEDKYINLFEEVKAGA